MFDPLVSVIIVNYNGKKYLKKCFDSLLNGSYTNIEIIFVDNGSRDNSIEFVRSEYPQVTLVDNQSNCGLAIASNEGAKLAKGKYLFFYNNDTIADPDLVSELVTVAEKNPRVGVCACKTLTYDGRDEVSTGVSCDIFGFPSLIKGPIFYADAGIFIRKTVFTEIEGFDPELFLYGEDRDLCWRVLMQGYDIVPVPTAIFYHDSACTPTGQQGYKTNSWKRCLGERNLIRSLLKNYSAKTLLTLLPYYALLSAAEITLLLIKGEVRIIYSAYLKAYVWNIEKLPDTLRLRRSVQQIRKVDDRTVQKKMIKGSGKIELYKRIGIPSFEAKAYKL